MQGRMQTMAEIFGRRQAELNQSIREQLTGMSNNLGQTINAQTKSTHENLAKLQERLAIIDTAQNNIQLTQRKTTSSRLPAKLCSCRRF